MNDHTQLTDEQLELIKKMFVHFTEKHPQLKIQSYLRDYLNRWGMGYDMMVNSVDREALNSIREIYLNDLKK